MSGLLTDKLHNAVFYCDHRHRFHMDDLPARVLSLFRSYAAAIELNPDSVDRLCDQFRRDLGELIAEYGHAAVDRAIDELPDGPWPSVSLH
jgi:hypothetical protein